MPARAVVPVHQQVVLVAAHVDRPAKVAALEARLEEESAARHELRPRRHEVRRVVHNAVEDQPRLLLPPPPLLRRPEQHVCVGNTGRSDKGVSGLRGLRRPRTVALARPCRK